MFFTRQITSILLLASLSPLAGSQEAGPRKEEKIEARQEWLRQFFTGGETPNPESQVKSLEAVRQTRAAQGQAAQRVSGAEGTPSWNPQWIPIGPAPGRDGRTAGGSYDRNSGRVSAIAVDPRNKDVVYAGAASGGVWKTTNGGQSWLPLTDDQASLATGSIAIDPSNPDVIYVGTGENKSGGYWGAGILKSSNAGVSWQLIGTELAQGEKFIGGIPAIGSISVSPDGSRVLASVFNESGNNGVFLSTDGGQTWSRKLGTGMSRPYDVVFASNALAYASVSSMGIFKSVDGGSTWVNTSQGTIVGASRIEIAVSRQDANVVFAAVEASNGGSVLMGVFRTSNGGTTWTKLETAPNYCGPQCFWDLDIAVNPIDHNQVWGAGSAGMHNLTRSLDGGQSWTDQSTKFVHVDQQALAYSADGTRLYLGNDGGVYSTDTAAASPVIWNNLNTDLQTTQHYRGFDVHPTDPSIMLAGSQDNGTHYAAGGGKWLHATCGDGAAAVISQTNPTISYVGCQMGSLDRSWTGRPNSWFNSPSRPGDGEYAHFIPMWVGDPTDGDTVYYVNHRLWQTRDAGELWHPITESIAGDPQLGTIYSAAPCRENPDLVYVGSTVGTVKKLYGVKTSPVGTVLPFVDASAGLVTRAIYSIAVHPEKCDEVAITSGGFTGGRVWYSNNGGAAWTNITGDLPELAAYAVILDPDVPGVIYVSTSLTVFFTQNGGQTWQPLGTGLPNAQGVDMKLLRGHRILRLITHGRGVWDAHVPIVRSGPYLATTPGRLLFSDQSVQTQSRRSAAHVVLENQGAQPLSISGMTAPAEFLLDRSLCANELLPGQKCLLTLRFDPLDQGFISGALEIQSNDPRGVTRVFLEAQAEHGTENDTIATAKVIPALPYRDKVATRTATTSKGDPSSGCPAVLARNVWYRYTATEDRAVKVSTVGSDYHTTISVFVGMAAPFTLVGCSMQLAGIDEPVNTLTFNAVAGTTYSIMVGSRHVYGGSLVLSVDWPDHLDVRPGRLVFRSAVGMAAVSKSFEIRNRSRSLALQITNLAVSGNFTVEHNCAALSPQQRCGGRVTYVPASSASSSEGVVTFNVAGGSEVYRMPITAMTSELVLGGPRGRRSGRHEQPLATITAGGTTEVRVGAATAPGVEGEFALECYATGGLQCTVTPPGTGTEVQENFEFTVRIAAGRIRGRPLRLRKGTRFESLTISSGGTKLFSGIVRVNE